MLLLLLLLLLIIIIIIDVEQTLSAMDRIIGYHHIADEVEPKLMEGWVLLLITINNYYYYYSPTGNIEGYLKLLDKLRAAVDFFKNNNASSMELSHVVSDGGDW